MSCRYISIHDYDIKQADGISVSVWMQGCPHRCKGCYNPETWNMDVTAGLEFTNETIEHVIKLLGNGEVKKNLSILGGEPLLTRNLQMLTTLCKRARDTYPDIQIWLWTGYSYDEVKHLEIIKELDYVIDGKYIEELRELSRYKGSSNQNVIQIRTTI